jgi:hypothetical protein
VQGRHDLLVEQPGFFFDLLGRQAAHHLNGFQNRLLPLVQLGQGTSEGPGVECQVRRHHIPDDSPEKTSLDDRALGSQSVGFDPIVKSGPMHQTRR